MTAAGRSLNDADAAPPQYSPRTLYVAGVLEMSPEKLLQKIDVLEAEADNGTAESQVELGTIYYLRDQKGDRAAGAEWFSNAAKNGNLRADMLLRKYAQKPFLEKNAQYNLAMTYPLTVEYDEPRADLLFSACESRHPKAFAELKKAADAEPPSPHSLSRMGDCYARGVGVAKNLERAIEYYTLAAELGVSKAQKRLDAVQVKISSQNAS